jgi:hypothetical protein
MNRWMMGILAGALVVGGALAAEIQSGPQAGAKIGPFHPLNVTGESAGEKVCLVCKNGPNPVAMIFARDVSPGLTNLVKKIDAATAKNKAAQMGSFVVFTSDNPALEAKAKKLAETEKLQHTVLSIDNPAGPKGLNLSPEADVIVVLYVQNTVKANHAFKGQLTDREIEKVVADLAKILPERAAQGGR